MRPANLQRNAVLQGERLDALTTASVSRFDPPQFRLTIARPSAIPIRESGTLSRAVVRAISDAANSVHTQLQEIHGTSDWSSHISNNCADVNQRAASLVGEKLREAGYSTANLYCSNLNARLSGVDYPQDFQSPTIFSNHWLGYLIFADSLHVAIDLTARKYRCAEEAINADVIAAGSLAELNHKLCCYYGGRSWHPQRFDFGSYL